MYEVYLSTPLGVRLAILDRFESLSWTKVLNDVGRMTLTFSPEQVDWRLWALDRRVEVWRTSALPKLAGIYYLRAQSRTTDASGRKRIIWKGEDANGLLDRRIIAYYKGSQQASRTDYADSLIKELVKDNLGPDAGTGRDIRTYGFSIEGDRDQGPVLTADCGTQRLLSTCQFLAQSSRDLGTRLYFQIMHPTMTTLQFRTYVNHLGVDRTNSATPFSLNRKTLAGPVTVSEDHSEEVNYVYAAGQGVEEDREIVAVSDSTAINASPFGRREALADGRDYETTNSLTTFGRRKLEEWKTRTTFEAALQEAAGSRYQVDWDFGDLVVAEYDEQTFNCEVDAVQGTGTPDAETITARLVSYD
jgi:hypothetical protein